MSLPPEPLAPAGPTGNYAVVYRPAPGSPTLGRIAMIMAIAVFALSLLASTFIGLFATTVAVHHTATSVNGNANADPVLALLHIGLGTIFGIWALAQGIVAVAQNRGRRFGVVAIVLAGLAPGLSFLLWSIVSALAGSRLGA